MTPAPRTIAIIGAGFSGTALAIHLLRQLPTRALRIVLVDAGSPGRGVAYAARDYPYLLNVPAGRMSADPEDHHDFLRFLKQRLPDSTAEDFVPRHLYGDYLETRLRTAQSQASPQIRLTQLRCTALALEPLPQRGGYRIQLDGGETVAADAVVLATGNPPPAPLPGAESLPDDGRYLADPWRAPASVRTGETLLIVGTGLTMADVAIASARRIGDLRIHALSRHGWLPPSQTAFGHAALGSTARDELRAASQSARALFGAVRALAAELAARGGDWREVITFVRQHAPGLWRRFAPSERRRFLRHARSLWDIHRHRLPQQTLAELERLRSGGRLSISAGRILNLQPRNGRVCVTWRARGVAAPETLVVDRVVNCTGPDYDVRRSPDPLLRSLLTNGLALPDPLGLGIRTGIHGQLLAADEHPSPDLYCVGPLLRSAHWECTAVHELREHAVSLARHLLMPSRHLACNSAREASDDEILLSA